MGSAPELINNRYRVLRHLGEGGMATVFLVQDALRDQRLMALKQLRAGLMDADSAAHLKSEFENLTRLSHPHLAEVFDMGLIEGTDTYYFTQEFVNGANIFEATRGQSPSPLYALVTQVCRVLEYIHSRGLVHHDLKPTNIMVTNEEAARAAQDLSKDDLLALLASPYAYNTVKLLDFGLAGAFVKEAGRNKVKGSVHYIAPEVARGEPVDTRADLYSLGVTLYHIFTGQVPFDAGSALMVVRKHLEEVPAAPSTINAKISPGFEQIILKLMAKNPADRFARAADVIMAINRIAGREFEVETRETKRGYVLSAKFVGREQEFLALKSALDEVHARKETSQAAFTLLAGEAGIGKSRILREFRIHCQLQNHAYAEGHGYERSARAFGPFVETLRQIIRLGAGKQRVTRFGAELVKLLPELAEEFGLKPSAALEPHEEHLRLLDTVASFLLDVARDRTVVVCLNDLHLADQGTFDLLRHLAANLHLQRGRIAAGEEPAEAMPRLFLVGASRLEEAGPFPALVREMEAEGLLRVQRLTRFGADGVRALIRGMFGEVHGLDFVSDRLTIETGGNPFFVQEVMMTLVEKGIVTWGSGQWRMGAVDLNALEIPRTIDEVVRRRLSGLTPEELALLKALAVIERPADAELVTEVAGVGAGTAGPALRALERKGFVVREDSATAAPGPVRLLHATIQKVVYAALEEAERKALHHRMAEALERDASTASHRVAELARHFLRAGEPKHGIQYGLAAGRELVRLFAHDQARALFQSLLALPGLPQAAAAEVAMRCGEVDRIVGRYDDALTSFERALGAFPEGDARRGQIYAQMADIYQIKGDHDRFSDSVARAKEIFTNAGDKLGLGLVYIKLGEIFYQRGEADKAERYAKVSIGIAEGIGDRVLHCRALGNVGVFHERKAEYEEALRYFQKAIRYAEEAGNQEELARAHGHMSAIHRARGEFGEAAGFADRQMSLASAIGDKRRIAAAHASLAEIALLRGDHAESLRQYERALRIAEEIRDKSGVGHALAGLGLVQVVRGEFEQASPCLRRAAQIAMEVSDRRLLGHCHGVTGILHYGQGEYSESREYLARALQIFEEGSHMDGILDVSHWLARLHLAMGDGTAARSVAERALSISRSRGMRSHEARYLACMATVDRRTGNVEAALASLAKAAEVPEAARAADEKVYHATEEVFCLLEQEEVERAVECARAAVAAATRLGLRPLLCRACLAQGLALARCARDGAGVEAAREALERARELAQATRHVEFAWQVHAALAELWRKRNQPLKAGHHIEEVKRIFEQVQAKLPEELREGYLKDPRRRHALELAARVNAEVESRKDETTTLAADFTNAGADRWLANLVRDHAGTPAARDLGQLVRMLDVGRRIGAEPDPRKVLEYITDTAIELTGADRGFLVLKTADAAAGMRLTFDVSRNLGGRDIEDPVTKVSTALADRVIETGDIILTGNAPQDRRLKDLGGLAELRVRSIVCVPIRLKGAIAGALYLDSLFTEKAFGEREAAFLLVLTDHAAAAIENARLHRQMVVDRLSGAFVPGYVDGILERELDRCKRFSRVVSVLRVDLDRFQVINDFHGVESGNEVLREVCGLLRKGLRSVDVLGRGAEDEFDLVMPETERAEAVRFANRLRTEIATWPFQAHGRDINVTVSVGVVTCPRDADTVGAVREKLNEAIYNAKRNGRNCVFTYESGDEGERAVQRRLAQDTEVADLVASRDGITVLGMLMKVINAGLDLDKVLELALRMMLQVVRAERGFIMLKGVDGKFKPVAAFNVNDEEIGSPQFAFSHTIVEQVAKSGKPTVVSDALAESQFRGQDSIMDLQIRSIISVPIRHGEETIGAVYMDNQSGSKRFTDEDRELLTQFAGKLAGPVENSREYARTRDEADVLKRTLTTSLAQLHTKFSYRSIIGQSKPMQELFRLLDKITETNFPVILNGESGTGKELVAKAIHFNGPRKDRPFVAENCGALTETLLESELFGHVRGAFTGADREKDGLFSVANGGTLFLDEIGEMGLDMQKKLLRVLQEGEVRPVGGKKSLKVDVRIIAATHRDLKQMVEEGRFREDLYYRLNVFVLRLPPLRERRDDLPLLVEHFLEKGAIEAGTARKDVPREVMRRLMDYDWPGNIRQLENEIKRMVAFGGKALSVEDLSPEVQGARGAAAAGAKGGGKIGSAGRRPATPELGQISLAGKTWDQLVGEIYQAALDEAGGSVEKAALRLGLARSTFYYRLKECGITPKKGGKS